MKARNRKYLLTVAATFFENEKRIDGKLKIDNENVVFLATSKKNRLYKKIIPIYSIFDFVKKSSFGIIPNLLIFKTSEGDYKFAVYGREQVIKTIESIKDNH